MTTQQILEEYLKKDMLYCKFLGKLPRNAERWSWNFKRLIYSKPTVADLVRLCFEKKSFLPLLSLTYAEFYYSTKCEKLDKQMQEIKQEMQKIQQETQELIDFAKIKNI